MNDREIMNKLGQATPPEIRLPAKKAALRRELLQQSRFRNAQANASKSKMRFAFGLMALVSVALLLVLLDLQPQHTLARDLIENMQQAYTQRDVASQVHFLRILYRSPLQEAVERRSWIYHQSRKARFLYRDPNTGKVLAHLIADSSARYALPNSMLELHYDMNVFDAKPDETSTAKQQQDARENINVVFLPVPESGQRGDLVQAMIMSDTFDRTEFEQQTPSQVVASLRSSENVRHIESAIDSASGQKLEILERRAAHGAFSFKLIFSRQQLDDVQEMLNALRDVELSPAAAEAYFARRKIRGQLQVKETEVIEKIAVFKETARIHSIDLTVYEEGREAFRAHKTILEDALIDYSPALFDPQRFGLTAQPQQGERKRPAGGQQVERFLIEQERVEQRE